MIPRARTLVAAAIGGALLMASALTGTASAATSYIYSATLAKTEADAKKVAEYWKPDRLKKADSSTPATPGAKSTATSAAAATAGPKTSAAPKTAATPVRDVLPAAPAKGGPARTMGKVFFLFGGKEYWCSASAVASKGHNLVATAGHCAYDVRQSAPADNWIFVPNPGADGSTPDGFYVGATLSMHEDWAGQADYDRDFAFVTVHRGYRWVTGKDGSLDLQDAGQLQDNVGGQGLTTGKGFRNQITAFGYPAGAQPNGTRPFDGRTLKTCEGMTNKTVAPARGLDQGVQLRGCDFSAGASGGPWLLNFQPSTKLGVLNGINSLTWQGTQGKYDAISSPAFTAVTYEVYRHAEGRDS
ncbi:trypsin-like serine peptidase [Nonomuraea sp. NPDC050556]|uniref:trypsin-like serine peptidase n=1 Tax=Nonomuraea sp. NPDC050556 TaxID=3364369 RepID=UPI0037AD7FB5